MSRPKKQKENTFFSNKEVQTGDAEQEGRHYTPEELNDIFQRAIRSETLTEIGHSYGTDGDKILKRIKRICRNALAYDNKRIYDLDATGRSILVSINQWASKYIEWQIFRVKSKRTVEEVAKLIGAPVELIEDHIRSKGWGQTKAQLGEF